MLVVVITISGMQVTVVRVVDVIAVRYRLMPAVRAVLVSVTSMRQMRERMLVVVAIMRRVRVAFVHVVDMSLALGACVSAARPVYVVVIVNVMLGGCHASSLL